MLRSRAHRISGRAASEYAIEEYTCEKLMARELNMARFILSTTCQGACAYQRSRPKKRTWPNVAR